MSEEEYEPEDEEEEEMEEMDEEDEEAEFQALLRIFLTRNLLRRDAEEEVDPAAVEAAQQRQRSKQEAFQASDFGRSLRKRARPPNLHDAVLMREDVGLMRRHEVLDSLLPQHGERLCQLRNQMFSGKYSPDGELYASSCQDAVIRIFDTYQWRMVKQVHCNDVSWAVLDTDYSPDKRWLAYCTWSSRFHLVNTTGDVETHNSFELHPPARGRFCLFSLRFSPDSSEILGGSCDEGVYVYDLVSEKRTGRFEGHSNDINAVCYLNDGSGNLVVSGSDDTMLRVYDKREGGCVGSFAGHVGGITSVDSRDDTYLLSNSKDQSIKLWDVRMMGPADAEPRFRQQLDYRMGGAQMRALLQRNVHNEDASLMTYKGHAVLQTLIRAYFSPDGRYIYSGSFDGRIRIFDIFSGEVVQTLSGHQGAVRDLSWNPVAPELASVSWDGSMRVWSPEGRDFLDATAE